MTDKIPPKLTASAKAALVAYLDERLRRLDEDRQEVWDAALRFGIWNDLARIARDPDIAKHAAKPERDTASGAPGAREVVQLHPTTDRT